MFAVLDRAPMYVINLAEETDYELALAARVGDVEAFDELGRRHRRTATGFARRLGASPALTRQSMVETLDVFLDQPCVGVDFGTCVRARIRDAFAASIA